MNPVRYAAIVTIFLASAACGQTAYSQPTTSNDANVGFGFFSHSEPRPTRNYKHADNFTLVDAAQIRQVRWWGLSEGRLGDDLSNFDQFTVEFWSSTISPNENSIPDSLLTTQTYSLENTQPTPTGRTSPASDALEYVHEATLDTPISLDADSTYFVVVAARSINGRGDGWQWQDSDLYDGYTVSWSYTNSEWLEFQDTDSAFELIAVPAPQGSALLIAAMGLASRRRRIMN